MTEWISNQADQLTDKWVKRLVNDVKPMEFPGADSKQVEYINGIAYHAKCAGVLLGIMELQKVGLLDMDKFVAWLLESEQ